MLLCVLTLLIQYPQCPHTTYVFMAMSEACEQSRNKELIETIDDCVA